MARYFTRQRASGWGDPTYGATITVHDIEREPVKTGLLDKDGREIMRAPDARPVGFVHFDQSAPRRVRA